MAEREKVQTDASPRTRRLRAIRVGILLGLALAMLEFAVSLVTGVSAPSDKILGWFVE